MTEHTGRGGRGLILPGSTGIGNSHENTLPQTVGELTRLGISPLEVALDGGFQPGPTNSALEPLAPKTVFIAGRQEPPPDTPNVAWPGTEPARKAGSATSNAATGWTAAGSKATSASRSGLSGESWPTTPTPSPSEPGETLTKLARSEQTHSLRNGRARSLRGRFVSQRFIRGK